MKEKHLLPVALKKYRKRAGRAGTYYELYQWLLLKRLAYTAIAAFSHLSKRVPVKHCGALQLATKQRCMANVLC